MQIENGVWYTPTEVCEILRVSATTLWRWRNQEVLVPFQIGRKTVRYRGADILRAATRQAVRPERRVKQ